MKYKITAPNKGYNGDTAGILFSNGIAITEKEQDLDWLRAKGYAVELQDDQPFIVDGKEIGKVEGEYITITDEESILETMLDKEPEQVEEAAEPTGDEAEAEKPEAPAETEPTDTQPEAPAKKPRGKKE